MPHFLPHSASFLPHFLLSAPQRPGQLCARGESFALQGNHTWVFPCDFQLRVCSAHWMHPGPLISFPKVKTEQEIKHSYLAAPWLPWGIQYLVPQHPQSCWDCQQSQGEEGGAGQSLIPSALEGHPDFPPGAFHLGVLYKELREAVWSSDNLLTCRIALPALCLCFHVSEQI